MTQKEKAQELIEKHIKVIPNKIPFDTAWNISKQCTLITVDEKIDILSFILQELAATQARTCSITKKLLEELIEVKQEIENI